jgi:hypothetical protein
MIIECPEYILTRFSYSLESFNLFCEFDANEFHENFPFVGNIEVFNIDAGNTTLEMSIYTSAFSQRAMLLDMAIRLRGVAKNNLSQLIDELTSSTMEKPRKFSLMTGGGEAPILLYDQPGCSVYLKLSDEVPIYNIDLGGCYLFLSNNERLCGAGFNDVIFDHE